MKLCLPYTLWPEQDRARWEAVFTTKIDLFDEHATATHLSDATRECLKYAYGRFLAFLSAYNGSLLALPAADRLDPKIIEAYINWQPKSCGRTSRAIYLQHLQLTLRYICPHKDWSWLGTIANRIAAQDKQRPRKYHLVTSEALYALGLQLMDSAVNLGDLTNDVCSKQALAYRDGLLIALLALNTVAPTHFGGAAHRKTSGAMRKSVEAGHPGRRRQNKSPARLPGCDGVVEAHRHILNPIPKPNFGRDDARPPLGVATKSTTMRRGHLYHRPTPNLRNLGFCCKSASFSPCGRNTLVNARPCQCARRKGPTRTRIIWNDRELLHYGTIACRRSRSCSGHWSQTKVAFDLSTLAANRSVTPGTKLH